MEQVHFLVLYNLNRKFQQRWRQHIGKYIWKSLESKHWRSFFIISGHLSTMSTKSTKEEINNILALKPNFSRLKKKGFWYGKWSREISKTPAQLCVIEIHLNFLDFNKNISRKWLSVKDAAALTKNCANSTHWTRVFSTIWAKSGSWVTQRFWSKDAGTKGFLFHASIPFLFHLVMLQCC